MGFKILIDNNDVTQYLMVIALYYDLMLRKLQLIECFTSELFFENISSYIMA